MGKPIAAMLMGQFHLAFATDIKIFFLGWNDIIIKGLLVVQHTIVTN